MTTPQEPEDREPSPAPPPPNFESQSEPDSGAPPREVQMAFWLWIATAVFIFVTSAILFLGRETAAQEARNTRVENMSPEQLEAASVLAAIVLSLVGVVLAAFVAWTATRLRTGAGWARLSLTVAGIAIILFNIIGFSALGLLTAFAAFGGIVLLYLKPANDFFVAAKQSR